MIEHRATDADVVETLKMHQPGTYFLHSDKLR